MYTAMEILLIWIAFILAFFTDHIKNIYNTLQPKPISRQRWWAVMKGTFTKKTAFPMIILALLSVAIFTINYFEAKSISQRDSELINRIDKVLEQNAEILKLLETQLEAQNDSTNK